MERVKGAISTISMAVCGILDSVWQKLYEMWCIVSSASFELSRCSLELGGIGMRPGKLNKPLVRNNITSNNTTRNNITSNNNTSNNNTSSTIRANSLLQHSHILSTKFHLSKPSANHQFLNSNYQRTAPLNAQPSARIRYELYSKAAKP